MVKKFTFGNYKGKKVFGYKLSSDLAEVELLEYGACINRFVVSSRKGKVDVVQGFENMEQLLEGSAHHGAVAGRCANRIAGGKFTLDGKTYQLEKNNGNNHLHGGFCGFSRRLYRSYVWGNKVYFTLTSPDGDQGYPSKVKVTVRYSIEGDTLHVDYFAKSDGTTPLNLTNHAYFNLNGDDSTDIGNHELTVCADYFTPVDKGLIPLGNLQAVKGTPFDFSSPKKIGKDIDSDDEQLALGNGYDHNFCLRGGVGACATAYSDQTGLCLEVSTDRKGLQFYSGNGLKGKQGKHVYPRRSAFCLETQDYPNALNTPEFGATVIHKGEKYHSHTLYRVFQK